jgi:adenylylsulfate kinase
MSYHEKHSRSIAKAISYRIVSIVADLLLVYTLTQKVQLTLGIVVVSNTVSIFLYYFHERAWNRIHFGRHVIKERWDDTI